MANPKVKLLTWWMRDDTYIHTSSEYERRTLSHGIWETIGVKEAEKGRVYRLRCVMPMHRDQPIMDEAEMYEEVLTLLCHQVTLTHLPKIEFKSHNPSPEVTQSNDTRRPG